MKVTFSFMVLVLLLGTFASASPIVIDDFNHGDGFDVGQRNEVGYTDQIIVGGGLIEGVINGYRTLEACLDSGSNGSSAIIVRATNDSTNVSCTFSGPSGTVGSTMLYWGLGNQNVGDLSLNLDLSGQTAFELSLTSSAHTESNDLVFQIEVETLSGGISTLTKTVSIVQSMSETVLFDFADFTDVGGVTWTDVDKILLKTDASFPAGGAVAVNFEKMEAVPEPMTFGLLSLGGLALLAFRRRFTY